MSASIKIKFGTLSLNSTNNITVGGIKIKDSKRVKATNIPKTDGAIAETAKIGPKLISVTGDIAGTSYDDFRTNIDSLKEGLMGQGIAALTLDDERSIKCQLKDFSKSYDHLSRIGTWKASFIVHFPFWQALYENQISNQGMELWTNGDSSAPDGWSLTGASATVAKEDTIIKKGLYSVAITRNGTNCNLGQSVHAGLGISYWQGKTIIVGAWVYATVAARGYLYVQDGVDNSLSDAHAGDSAWEYITVSHTVNSSATELTLRLIISGGDTTVYYDDIIVIEGSNISAANVIDERRPSSGVGYTINNPGNAPTRAKIEIVPTAEMADSCQFENTTKGQIFVYAGTVSADDTLEIDNRYDTDDFEVLNDGSDDHANFSGDFIDLDPGDNTIEFTGTANTTIKITFKPAWY